MDSPSAISIGCDNVNWCLDVGPPCLTSVNAFHMINHDDSWIAIERVHVESQILPRPYGMIFCHLQRWTIPRSERIQLISSWAVYNRKRVSACASKFLDKVSDRKRRGFLSSCSLLDRISVSKYTCPGLLTHTQTMPEPSFPNKLNGKYKDNRNQSTFQKTHRLALSIDDINSNASDISIRHMIKLPKATHSTIDRTIITVTLLSSNTFLLICTRDFEEWWNNKATHLWLQTHGPCNCPNRKIWSNRPRWNLFGSQSQLTWSIELTKKIKSDLNEHMLRHWDEKQLSNVSQIISWLRDFHWILLYHSF
jgi:hypothetical protein